MARLKVRMRMALLLTGAERRVMRASLEGMPTSSDAEAGIREGLVWHMRQMDEIENTVAGMTRGNPAPVQTAVDPVFDRIKRGK